MLASVFPCYCRNKYYNKCQKYLRHTFTTVHTSTPICLTEDLRCQDVAGHVGTLQRTEYVV